MTVDFVVEPIRWERFPLIGAHPLCRAWLTFQSQRGLSRNTLEAYCRGLELFLRFLSNHQLPLAAVTRVQVGAYLAMMQSIGGGPISNATIQQRLTVLRLFYSYLVEEGLCHKNPLLRDGGRPLVQRYRRLPWIPGEADWQAILAATRDEPIRNRVMLAFAYDAALRRKELCGLSTADIDPSIRMLRIRAENTKGRRDRVVPYSAASSALLQQYLNYRRGLSQSRGSLFLSESRRNYADALSTWSWSKDCSSDREACHSPAIHNAHAATPLPYRLSPCRLGYSRNRHVCGAPQRCKPPCCTSTLAVVIYHESSCRAAQIHARRVAMLTGSNI